MKMPGRVAEFFRDEEGATVVEYAVLITLIIAACVVVIFALGLQVERAYNDFIQSYSNAAK